LPAQEMDRNDDAGQNQEFTQKQQREQTKGQGNAQKTQQAIGAERKIDKNEQKTAQKHPIQSKDFEDTACVDARQQGVRRV
jgi:hypothetical protein